MNKYVKKYQCPGCVADCCDGSCYEVDGGKFSISCKNHVVGTISFPSVGKFALGMPVGFNRVGEQTKFQFVIFNNKKEQEQQWNYDKFNVPIWKYKNKSNHVFIRGFMPRLNKGFVHILLDCNYDKLDLIEVKPEEMD